jgi:hypothetical protein
LKVKRYLFYKRNLSELQRLIGSLLNDKPSYLFYAKTTFPKIRCIEDNQERFQRDLAAYSIRTGRKYSHYRTTTNILWCQESADKGFKNIPLNLKSYINKNINLK